MTEIQSSYLNGNCPDCQYPIPKSAVEGSSCKNCGHVFYSQYKKYVVTVNRIGYAQKYVELKAKNKKEARKTAMEAAGNMEFREHNAEYECEDVKEIE